MGNNNNTDTNNQKKDTKTPDTDKKPDEKNNTNLTTMAASNLRSHRDLYLKAQQKIEDNYMCTLMDNLEEYKLAFHRFAHGQEKLPLYKLGLLMRYLGLNPTESEVEDLKNEVDEDQNGVLDMNEFVNLVQDQFASQDNDEDLILLAFSQIVQTSSVSSAESVALEDIKLAVEQCKKLCVGEKDIQKLNELLIGGDKKRGYDKNTFDP